MTPMNNPLLMVLNAARSGGNPMQVMQQIAGQNPQAAQVMRMVQGKSPQQLQTMCENMCKERGVSVNDIARQLGVALPSNR